MSLLVEVIFYSGQRKNLPRTGYRPDAVFDKSGDYWGVIFTEMQVDKFDVPALAIMKFTFDDCHYREVCVGQKFSIMEGGHRVGEGKIILMDMGK